jgi:hypothetical protein
MRTVGLAAVLLVLGLAGDSEGQGKKPAAVAFDAKFVRFDLSKKGLPARIRYQPSPEDAKKAGRAGNHAITARTRFVYVGPEGETKFTNKTVMDGEEGKTYLVEDAKIRVQVTATEAEEIRFGPELKSEPFKRVR